ncbi:MAG: hypothetical protein LUI06_04725 [Ruminococcus sp.]|nr:hypothetical protein [Ruminococcus sp.]
MSEEFRWIDNSIDISSFYDRLSPIVKGLIKEAEKADRANMDVVYEDTCDDIEIQAKLLVPDVISFKEWHMICDKYYPFTG